MGGEEGRWIEGCLGVGLGTGTGWDMVLAGINLLCFLLFICFCYMSDYSVGYIGVCYVCLLSSCFTLRRFSFEQMV